jgi:hypothetical protein
MDTVPCIQCLGTGKEFDSMSLTTGAKKYRQCSVCQGSGTVSAERSHFSQYPDVSLRKAQELMQIHGKPARIDIAENEITVLFKDNTRFILGGFAVGYKGTGPDFAKRFLDEADFDISKEDIAAMVPPVTLLPGSGFIPPEYLVIGAPSLEETKQKAQQSIPADARVIALKVIYDGQQTAKIAGYGITEDAAIKNAQGRMPAGAEIVTQEMEVEFETKFIEGGGDSEEAAFNDARSRLPAGISADEEKVLQSVTGGCEEVQQYTDEYARKTAVSSVRSRLRNLMDADIQIMKVECIRPVRMRGLFAALLHIGEDKPGIYRITWKAPFKVSLKYRVVRRKIVHLTIRPQPSVQVSFQPAVRWEPCRLCQERFPVTKGRVLVHSRSDDSWDSVMFGAGERAALWIFNRMGMNLSKLSELRSDVFVCQKCFDQKFSPAALAFLNEQAALLETAFHDNLDQTSEHTGAIEHLGGLSELGFHAAFTKLLELYQAAPSKGFWKSSLSYWVLERSIKMSKQGLLHGQDLSTSTREAITENLEMKFKQSAKSAYMWNSLLDSASALIDAGVLARDAALSLSAGMQAGAADFLSTGTAGELDWGNPEFARQTAEAVLEKVQSFQRRMPAGK